MNHRFPLGDTGWSVWRDVLLRSAGFPITGLDRFAAPHAARAADALLDAVGGSGPGAEPEAAFDAAFEAALRDGAAAADRIAADPLFREAVTWQNPAAIVALDGLVAGGHRRNVRRRDREKTLVRYWQRYCGKCETIGFFGPVAWVRASDVQASTTVRPGPGLVAGRRVFFEAWALMAYADRLSADPAVRRWWPPALAPQLSLDGRRLLRPLRPPVDLSIVDAGLLGRCDGGTPAWLVVDRTMAAGVGLRSAADGFLALDLLVGRGLLHWDAGLPLSPDAETVLVQRIGAIGDPAVRDRVTGDLDRLRGRRDAVAASAGDPAALRVALSALDEEFTAVTGERAYRRGGQAYAGRTLAYEDTSRDVRMSVGRAVLDGLAAPLDILLRAARWLTAECGAASERILDDLYADLSGDGPVALSDIWALAQGPLFSAPGNPVDRAVAEFTARWTRLLGLEPDGNGPGGPDPGTRHAGPGGPGTPGAAHPVTPAGPTGPAGVTGPVELRRAAAELAGPAGVLFDAGRPGWPSARIHSVDVQVCAPDAAAIDRGDALFVLGELHPAVAPFDSALFSPWHPDPAALRAGFDADLGPSRIRPLYPDGYPRLTGRTRHGLTAPADCELGVAPARGASAGLLVPATSVRVLRRGDGLVALAPDGRAWPLIEVFAGVLGGLLIDAFKLLGPAGYTPRVLIDRLVVARRTWRTTVTGTGLAEVTGERDRFLAARRTRRRLGLPERVFIKIGTETKPCYVDFRGPAYVQMLCTMLRSAGREAGGGTSVTISEMLPSPRESWLPDAAGRRYASELRLQVTDPATYRPAGAACPRAGGDRIHRYGGE